MKTIRTYIFTLIIISGLTASIEARRLPLRSRATAQAKSLESRAKALISKSFSARSLDELQREYEGRKKQIQNFIAQLKANGKKSAAQRVENSFKTTFEDNFRRTSSKLQPPATTRVVPPPPPPAAFRPAPTGPPPAPPQAYKPAPVPPATPVAPPVRAPAPRAPKVPRAPTAPPMAIGRPPAGRPITKPAAPDRADLLQQIRSGTQLKPVENGKPTVVDTPDSLLAQIRAGKKLKPIQKQPKVDETVDPLIQRLRKIREAVELDDTEEDNADWDI